MKATAYQVAYILNTYPKVSHSFIRREIRELERRGLPILRISMRGWDSHLVDPDDLIELKKTTFVLKEGMARLFFACFRRLLRTPRRFVAATVLAIRMMRGSDRPAVWHLFYLAEACWISNRIEALGIKHLHAHFGTNPAEVAALSGILANVTFSITIHGQEEFDKLHSLHIREKVSRSLFTVAISSYCRSQIRRVLDYKDWEKVHVIHCGVDLEFAALPQGAPILNKRLVCVGRLCAEKGQLLLAQALGELKDQRQDFEVLFVGDGELREPLERIIEENDLHDFVRITGWATAAEVKREMLSARAVILPSFIEGLPVVLMEAMVLGRPVLSTYVGAIPELVVSGQNGWLFPTGSKDEMLEAICNCLDASSETIERMGRAARERALERHSTARQAELLLRLFGASLAGVHHEE